MAVLLSSAIWGDRSLGSKSRPAGGAPVAFSSSSTYQTNQQDTSSQNRITCACEWFDESQMFAKLLKSNQINVSLHAQWTYLSGRSWYSSQKAGNSGYHTSSNSWKSSCINNFSDGRGREALYWFARSIALSQEGALNFFTELALMCLVELLSGAWRQEGMNIVWSNRVAGTAHPFRLRRSGRTPRKEEALAEPSSLPRAQGPEDCSTPVGRSKVGSR